MILIFGIFDISAIATSAWAGTLRDNFSDGNLDGWRLFKGRTGNGNAIDEKAEWIVEDSELVCRSKGICQLASTFGIGDEKWKDYEFECEFKVEKTTILAGCGLPSFFGIGVRYNDKNKLITGIDLGATSRGGGWTVNFCELFAKGGFVNPGAAVGIAQIEEGKWYKSKFVVKSNDYEVSVGGKTICRFKNQLLDGGGVAFLGRNGEYHFDNVIITGNEIPNMNLSVTTQSKLTTIWGQIKSHQ